MTNIYILMCSWVHFIKDYIMDSCNISDEDNMKVGVLVVLLKHNLLRIIWKDCIMQRFLCVEIRAIIFHLFENNFGRLKALLAESEFYSLFVNKLCKYDL